MQRSARLKIMVMTGSARSLGATGSEDHEVETEKGSDQGKQEICGTRRRCRFLLPVYSLPDGALRISDPGLPSAGPVACAGKRTCSSPSTAAAFRYLTRAISASLASLARVHISERCAISGCSGHAVRPRLGMLAGS